MSIEDTGSLDELPGGAALAPGERILVGDRFMFSTIAFYLHTELALTNRRLYAMRPNTILGLIPVGTARSNFPVENIAGINAGTRFDLLGLLFGVIAVLVGLAARSVPDATVFAILLYLIGLPLIIGAPKQAIEVTNSGGGRIIFRVSLFERGRTLEFASRVSEAIARTPASHNVGEVRLESDATGSDPGDALRRLDRLRDQGLITEAEYDDKRTEILRRL